MDEADDVPLAAAATNKNKTAMRQDKLITPLQRQIICFSWPSCLLSFRNGVFVHLLVGLIWLAREMPFAFPSKFI